MMSEKTEHSELSATLIWASVVVALCTAHAMVVNSFLSGGFAHNHPLVASSPTFATGVATSLFLTVEPRKPHSELTRWHWIRARITGGALAAMCLISCVAALASSF